MALTQIFVDNTFGGTSLGTQAQPWKTLGDAEDQITDKANSGASPLVDVHVWVKKTASDYVDVHAEVGGLAVIAITQSGNNTEPIVWESYTTAIGDTGYSPNSQVTVDAGIAATTLGIFGSADYNHFIGFRVTGAASTGFTMNDKWTLTNCRLDNNGGNGLAQANNAHKVTCINCQFDNNSLEGANVGNGIFVNCTVNGNAVGAGILCDGSGIFINCIGFDNIEVGTGLTPFIANSTPFILYGCTCDGETEGFGALLNTETDVEAQALAVNNKFLNSDVGLNASINHNFNFPTLNNLYFNNTTDSNITGSADANHNDLFTDPLSIDESTGDYGLRPGSPAINTGLGTNQDIGHSQANRNQIQRMRQHNV